MSVNKEEDPSIHYCREVKISYGPMKKAAAITGAREAFELARKTIDPCADREHFAAVYLDAKNIPLAWRVIAIGTISSCLVHPREVLRPGLLVGCSATIRSPHRVASGRNATGNPQRNRTVTMEAFRSELGRGDPRKSGAISWARPAPPAAGRPHGGA